MALSATVYKIFKNFRKRDIVQLCRHSNIPNSHYHQHSEVIVHGNLDVNPLERTSEDLSKFSPYFPLSFNLAAFVNKSETLKNLVDLDVDLSKIEKNPYVVNKILKLDFDKHIKDHIIYISDYVGLNQVGQFITKNPLILCEPLEDLKVRVNYLESKRFTEEQIKRIVTSNPFWLMFSTVRIDRRLGYFQKKLDLRGEEVRYLVTKQPRLVTYNLHNVNCNLFVVKEEMGFEDSEIKELILKKPKILMLNQRNLMERFNYIHNVMKISHKTVLDNAELLCCRTFRIKQRHMFLEKLGRAQYSPMKECYVPVKALIEDTDSEFCKKYAKCNVIDFNLFLKTL